MNRQRGQTAVEFAIVLPFFFTFVFAALYVGFMFMDYTQYGNAARAIARDISLSADATARNTIQTELNAQDEDTIKRYATRFTYLYNPKFRIDAIDNEDFDVDLKSSPKPFDDKSIAVLATITFERDNTRFPTLLMKVNFPPATLGNITYKMPLPH